MQYRKNKILTKTQALAKLQRYCAYQDRCHQEVRTKLLELGVRGMDLEEIISELIQDNFLNEERYARSFARGKFNFKKWGKMKITNELRMRRISPYLLKKAMEEIEEEDYLKALKEWIDKKSRDYDDQENDYLKKQKIANFLFNKGFESGLVWKMLKDYSPD